jgi:acyl-CoA reductase-like NAD-dependent aldehyde dehydrogenase
MAEDVDAAVAAATTAFAEGEWAGLSATDRAKYVHVMAEGIAKHVDMLATIESADVGKSHKDAFMAINGCAGEG